MKPVKCNPMLLQMARATLLEKLRSRLEPEWSEFSNMRSVSGFKDPGFVAVFGPGLERFPDSELINQALLVFTEHVAAAPIDKTGLSFFDDRGDC